MSLNYNYTAFDTARFSGSERSGASRTTFVRVEIGQLQPIFRDIVRREQIVLPILGLQRVATGLGA